MLTKPLEEHVPAERKAGQRERLTRMLSYEASHDGIEIRRLAGVVEATRSCHLTIARAEDQCVGRPTAVVREREQPTQIVRSDRALQTMEHEQASTMWRTDVARVETTQLDLVSVLHPPALDPCIECGRTTHQLSPKGPQVCARYPPCGGIGILAGATHLTGDGVEARNGRPFYYIEPACMDVQIFGVKKNADTRKALRFFAERRIKTHFVDLMERAASRGELTRFAQKFGTSTLVDETTRRYGELGLRTARYGDERWLEILVSEPLILKMPLVRYGNALSVGAAEATWKGWLAL